jgi:pimeloyl-ACP methyl ester carboxylesterase
VPTAIVSDTRVAYEIQGSGDPVLLIPPAGTTAAVWHGHTVPALLRAGYSAVTVDHRGTPPSAVPPGPYRLADLVADTADLIDTLGLGPCRIAGASLGAMVAQELALARPDLVTAIALLGTRCRTDFFRRELARAGAARAREADGTAADYDALASMLQLFSARTLADDKTAADWFEVFRTFPVRGVGPAAQYEATIIPDRNEALGRVRRPCLVVAFGEDVLTPPALAREVAAAIPQARYVEIAGCGHFGFIEEPETVNRELTEFFTQTG